MIIGVPKEIKPQEGRIGMVPSGVAQLVEDGHTVLIEKNGGMAAGISDSDFEKVGATMLPTAADVWAKAAALLQSIVKNHPLVDGNKRLGWLATAVFLELNGVEATAISNDDVYELVVAVAGGRHEIAEIAGILRSAVEAAAS